MNERILSAIKEKHPLAPDDEIELLRSGDETIIKDYLWGNCLSPKAQIVLLETKNLNLIKFFIGQDPFCNEAEKKMIELADPKLLEAYISRHGIGKAAKIAILSSGNKALIRVCRKRRS